MKNKRLFDKHGLIPNTGLTGDDIHVNHRRDYCTPNFKAFVWCDAGDTQWTVAPAGWDINRRAHLKRFESLRKASAHARKLAA